MLLSFYKQCLASNHSFHGHQRDQTCFHHLSVAKIAKKQMNFWSYLLLVLLIGLYFGQFSTDLTEIFRSHLTLDNDHKTAFKIDIFSPFHTYNSKMLFWLFSTDLSQIFTSLLFIVIDYIAAFKIDIFSPFHAYDSKMLLWPFFNLFS